MLENDHFQTAPLSLFANVIYIFPKTLSRGPVLQANKLRSRESHRGTLLFQRP